MKDSKIPTGDPNCPAHIRTAKRAHWKIVRKSEITNAMSDEEDEELEPPEPVALEALQPSGENNKEEGSKKKKQKKSSPAFADKKKGAKGGNDLMEIFMMQRSESQERREQLEAQRLQSNQMMMRMFTSAIIAFTTVFSNLNTPTPGVPVAAVAPPRPWQHAHCGNKSCDDDTSLSTIDSFDSPPQICKKKEQQRKRKSGTK
jgi:hypothetical protein